MEKLHKNRLVVMFFWLPKLPYGCIICREPQQKNFQNSYEMRERKGGTKTQETPFDRLESNFILYYWQTAFRKEYEM